MIVSTISWGSLVAGDEGIARVSGEAPAERILRILARLRYQTRLASSSIAVAVNNKTRLLTRTLGGEYQNYLRVKTSGSSLAASRLFRVVRYVAIVGASRNKVVWCCLPATISTSLEDVPFHVASATLLEPEVGAPRSANPKIESGLSSFSRLKGSRPKRAMLPQT
jgi:hypothetical protein